MAEDWIDLQEAADLLQQRLAAGRGFAEARLNEARASGEIRARTGLFAIDASGVVDFTLHPQRRCDATTPGAEISRDDLLDWLQRTHGSSETAPKTAARVGRPSTVDWGVVEDALALEVTKRGLPDRDGEAGWRTRADVQRWVHSLLDDRGEAASDVTVRDHVRTMLERISQRK